MRNWKTKYVSRVTEMIQTKCANEECYSESKTPEPCSKSYSVTKLKYHQYSSQVCSISFRNVWWNFTLKILQKYFARAFSNKSFQVSKINEQKFKRKFARNFAKRRFDVFLNVSRFTQSYLWWKYTLIYGWKLLPVFGCSKKVTLWMLKIQLKDCERKNDAGRSIFGPAADEAGRIPKHAHNSWTFVYKQNRQNVLKKASSTNELDNRVWFNIW